MALGVSFGLVAYLLAVVLGLCFASELLVSGEVPVSMTSGAPVGDCSPAALAPACLSCLQASRG